ncbi:MAG: hypothetical protein CEO40_239 [Parcubacteria group bacterium LiPW_72]|nr:MAG: hypothetical protein CEO40_239 [Parcubacteria group bacterium LiPW_72]
MGFDGLYSDLYFERNEDDIPDNEDNIVEESNDHSQDHPWFSRNQISKIEELKPDMIVISYCAVSGDAVYYRIDGEVYYDETNNARVKASKMRNGKVIFTCGLHLADHGIVPYDTGFWNSSNCLLKTRSKKTKFVRLPKARIFASEI